MKYFAVAISLLAVPALAKSQARSLTPNAANGVKPGGKGSLRTRQLGEFCGTDDFGDDHYCPDAGTTCCTGYERWSCVELTSECCTTGWACFEGTHCYLDEDLNQLCLTPEEADNWGSGGDGDTDLPDLPDDGGVDSDDPPSGDDDIPDLPDLPSGDEGDDDDLGALGGGDDSGDDLGGIGGGDEGEDDDEGGVGGGVIGGGRRKGGSGSAAPKTDAGHILAGVVALGAVFVAQA